MPNWFHHVLSCSAVAEMERKALCKAPLLLSSFLSLRRVLPRGCLSSSCSLSSGARPVDPRERVKEAISGGSRPVSPPLDRPSARRCSRLHGLTLQSRMTRGEDQRGSQAGGEHKTGGARRALLPLSSRMRLATSRPETVSSTGAVLAREGSGPTRQRTSFVPAQRRHSSRCHWTQRPHAQAHSARSCLRFSGCLPCAELCACE